LNIGGQIPAERLGATLFPTARIAVTRRRKCGVAAVYTPKDYEINRIMVDVVRIVEHAAEKVA
jgi:hypothetical protein